MTLPGHIRLYLRRSTFPDCCENAIKKVMLVRIQAEAVFFHLVSCYLTKLQERMRNHVFDITLPRISKKLR